MTECPLRKLGRLLSPPAQIAQQLEDPVGVDAKLDSWQGPLGVPYENNLPQVSPMIQQTFENRCKDLYRSPRPTSAAILAATLDSVDDAAMQENNAYNCRLDSAIALVNSLGIEIRAVLEQPSEAHLSASDVYEPSIYAPSSEYSVSVASTRGRKRNGSVSFYTRHSAEDYAREYGQLIYDDNTQSFYSQPKPVTGPDGTGLCGEDVITNDLTDIACKASSSDHLACHHSQDNLSDADEAFRERAADDEDVYPVSDSPFSEVQLNIVEARVNRLQRQTLRVPTSNIQGTSKKYAQRPRLLAGVEQWIAAYRRSVGLDVVESSEGEEQLILTAPTVSAMAENRVPESKALQSGAKPRTTLSMRTAVRNGPLQAARDATLTRLGQVALETS